MSKNSVVPSDDQQKEIGDSVRALIDELSLRVCADVSSAAWPTKYPAQKMSKNSVVSSDDQKEISASVRALIDELCLRVCADVTWPTKYPAAGSTFRARLESVSSTESSLDEFEQFERELSAERGKEDNLLIIGDGEFQVVEEWEDDEEKGAEDTHSVNTVTTTSDDKKCRCQNKLRKFLAENPGGRSMADCFRYLRKHKLIERHPEWRTTTEGGVTKVRNYLEELDDVILNFSGIHFWARMKVYRSCDWCPKYQREYSGGCQLQQSGSGDELRVESEESLGSRSSSIYGHVKRSPKEPKSSTSSRSGRILKDYEHKMKDRKISSDFSFDNVRLLMRRYLEAYPRGQTLENCFLHWERKHPEQSSWHYLVSMKWEEMDDMECERGSESILWMRLKKFSDYRWCDSVLKALAMKQISRLDDISDSDSEIQSPTVESTATTSNLNETENVTSEATTCTLDTAAVAEVSSTSEMGISSSRIGIGATVESASELDDGKRADGSHRATSKSASARRRERRIRALGRKEESRRNRLKEAATSSRRHDRPKSSTDRQYRSQSKSKIDYRSHRYPPPKSDRYHFDIRATGKDLHKKIDSGKKSITDNEQSDRTQRESRDATEASVKLNRRSGEIMMKFDEITREFLNDFKGGTTLRNCFNYIQTLNPIAEFEEFRRKLDRLNDVQIVDTGKQLWIRRSKYENEPWCNGHKREVYGEDISDLEFACREYLPRYPHGVTLNSLKVYLKRTQGLKLSNAELKDDLLKLNWVEISGTVQSWIRMTDFNNKEWCQQYQEEETQRLGKGTFLATQRKDVSNHVDTPVKDLSSPEVRLEAVAMLCNKAATMTGGMPVTAGCALIKRGLGLKRRVEPEELKDMVVGVEAVNFEFLDTGVQLWMRLKEFADLPWWHRVLKEAKMSFGSDDICYPNGKPKTAKGSSDCIPVGQKRPAFSSKYNWESDEVKRRRGIVPEQQQSKEPPRCYNDPRTQLDISMSLCQFLQNYRQGQPLTVCCDHINRVMNLNKNLSTEDMHKLLSFVSNVELKDSGVQRWVKLRVFHDNGWSNNFMRENADYLGISDVKACLDNLQQEPDSTTSPIMPPCSSSVPSSSKVFSGGAPVSYKSPSHIMTGPIVGAGRLIASQQTMVPPQQRLEPMQAAARKPLPQTLSVGQFGVSEWTRQNDAHVELALQIISYQAGMTDGGLRFSEVGKVYHDRTGFELTYEELKHLRDKIVREGDILGLEIVPDFERSDLRILLKFN